MSTAAELHLHDQVRLLVAQGDVRAGAIGQVLGWFARPSDARYVVSFEGGQAAVEIPAGDLEPHTPSA